MSLDEPTKRDARLPTIDTLRGAAIVLVVGYHFAPIATAEPIGHALWSVLRVGWVGVDLFFVLSGFLITGILLDARARFDVHPAREMLRFFGRRAFRIMPAYYLLLTVLLVVHAVGMVPGESPAGGAALVQDQWWYWLFASNVRIATNGEWTNLAWVEHLWSLAVEEQFYLLWPLLLAATPRRRLPLAMAVLVPLAFACRLYAVETGESLAAYVLTPARCDTLALGAIAALLYRAPHRHRLATSLAIGGALVSGILLIGVVTVAGPGARSPTMGTIGHTLWALLFASLLWLAVAPPEVVPPGATSPPSLADTIRARWQAALTARRGLRWLATYSYGIYLVHLPVRAVLENVGLTPRELYPDWGWWPSTVVGMSLGTALSVGLAVLSWKLVERPMQQFGRNLLGKSVTVVPARVVPAAE